MWWLVRYEIKQILSAEGMRLLFLSYVLVFFFMNTIIFVFYISFQTSS